MNRGEPYRQALVRLRAILSTTADDQELRELIEVQPAVLSRYQPTFQPENLESLTAEGCREFLLFRNNRHWTGLQRMGPAITRDMAALRGAIGELLNESTSIADRLAALLPDGKARVTRLGKAVLTPILLIAHPEKYGVWNGTSEGAMRELQIWPEFDRGVSVGKRYEQINGLLLDLARDLGVDLWTLDALWWRVLRPVTEIEGIDDDSGDLDDGPTVVGFALERHLHDFMLDNWENTDLGKEWDLAQDGGDIKGYGYERPTSVGRIDLLAFHKSEKRWLVIELKRDQTSDKTIGQLLRYMGWVKRELATVEETVEGLVIARSDDEKLRYALAATEGIRFMRYEVDFRLVSGGD